MTAGVDVEKNDPADVVAQAYDGPLEQLHPQLSGSWAMAARS